MAAVLVLGPRGKLAEGQEHQGTVPRPRPEVQVAERSETTIASKTKTATFSQLFTCDMALMTASVKGTADAKTATKWDADAKSQRKNNPKAHDHWPSPILKQSAICIQSLTIVRIHK